MEAQAVPREAATGTSGMASPVLLGLATDSRLVTSVRNGNTAAFEVIYDRYHRPILSFCRHMLGDPEEAADVVQHTFMAAYKAIISSDKPILLRAWLFTIARNRCYSVLRSRREQAAGEMAEPATEGLAVQVQRREELRQLLSDMHRLPDDQRAALILAELDTLTHQEIGSALGVPPTKVKALVFQARESLMASRSARDMDCQEIRQQLSTLRGGALRRGHLRRHLSECSGCREFRGDLERQRRSLAAILPVVPSLALKEAVLGGISSGGATAGALAGGGLIASTAFKGLAIKGLIGGAIALIGTAGTVAVVRAIRPDHRTVMTQGHVVFASDASHANSLGAVLPVTVVPLGFEPFAHHSARSHQVHGRALGTHRLGDIRTAHHAVVAIHHERSSSVTRSVVSGETAGPRHAVRPAAKPAPPLHAVARSPATSPSDSDGGDHVKQGSGSPGDQGSGGQGEQGGGSPGHHHHHHQDGGSSQGDQGGGGQGGGGQGGGGQ